MEPWIENYLTIEANTDEEIVALLEAIKYKQSPAEAGGEQFEIAEFGSDLSLEAIRPHPPRDQISDFVGGIDRPVLAWREEHWGTAWDVQAKLTSRAEGLALLEFDSFRRPPIVAIQYLADQNPRISFRLMYRGDGQSGTLDIQGVAQ